MRAPSRYLLSRKQDIRHGHRAKLHLADKAVIVGLIFGVDVDIDVHVANRIAPGGIALCLSQAFRREDQVHVFLPRPAEEAYRLSAGDAFGYRVMKSRGTDFSS